MRQGACLVAGLRTYSRRMDRATLPTSAGVPDMQPSLDRRRRPSARRFGMALALAVAVVAALGVWRLSSGGAAPVTRADVDRAVQSAITRAQQQQRQLPPDAGTAYRTILPSLVTVTAQSPTATTSPTSGTTPSTTTGPTAGTTPTAAGTPSLKGVAATGTTSLGAGVVINAAGAVLTALHVVAGSPRIQVEFSDGTRTTARIANGDPATDVAVLIVDQLPSVVVPAVMAGRPRVGDTVFPVGNPLGLRATLTAGVVSALDRSVETRDGRSLQGLIQFDAAVNPGNSGGPLLDRDGHVVGVVTGLANPSQQAYFVGIGFAVPIATAGGVAGGPQQ